MPSGWNEALHGVQAKSPPINTTTVFPAPMTTAASFNKTLFHMVGAAESTEARAVYNLGGNQLTDWSPNINLCAPTLLSHSLLMHEPSADRKKKHMLGN